MNRHLRYAGTVGAVGVIYWLAARAMELWYLHGTVTAVWPSTGLMMAAVTLIGPRVWPGIVVGDLAIRADLLARGYHLPLGTALGETLGNTIEALIAGILFYRLARGRTDFGRVRDIAALVAAAVAATAVGACFGPTALRLGGVIAAGDYGRVWRTWFLSDLVGALVFAPLVLTWSSVRIHAIGRRNALEGLIVLASIFFLALVPSPQDVPYVLFPPLIWAALRAGPRGAAAAVAAVTLLTTYDTAHHGGPFVRATITQTLLATQLFVAVAALTALVLGAVIEERRGALDALRESERVLRASRARIVEAGDEERRRLERNLHDGAQQRLVSLALTLRLAKLQMKKDPAEAQERLAEASDELNLALEELRELARGIHPAVLTDRGLEPALKSLAAHVQAHVQVDLQAQIPQRLPPVVEAAVYYIAAEGLTNVAKYARASAAEVTLDTSNGSVVLSITDDGAGGADPERGTGLRGLADRVEALGGSLELRSPPGQGTRLTASIPWRRDPLV